MNRNDGWLRRQVTDAVAYLLVPAISVLIPAALSRRLLRRVSRWNWLLASDAGLACEHARHHLSIADEGAWKLRWKRVELMDVRDLFLMLCGRSGAVLAEIELDADLEDARDHVMVGMHWGPAISLLRLLAAADMEPAFPFRRAERALLRSRPFYYFFCRLAEIYLDRTLGERAVPIGGAGRVLRKLLEEPGSICVLMDAPPLTARRSSRREVLGSTARFQEGFAAMMADRRKEYVLYAMNLAPGESMKKRLEMEGPFVAESPAEFLDRFAAFLDRHLAADAPQWRIWRAEGQFWER